ncbi:MAG TPA: BON domain-containing protein [Candidatus Hydrogenedentes bacterium]|nr:BON domain-containing protein [Candidatus Hydrogenedentota bacterium]HNT89322.1 BON domain-containing protein [Candidatus Hydrogenedentota bacterium]
MVAAVLLAVLAGVVSANPVVETVEDSSISARVASKFLMNKHLSPLNITTSTSAGVVTLSGSVREDAQKQLAEELAREVPGVVDVRNELLVVPTAYTERQKRGFGQRMRDASVSANVRGVLLRDGETKGVKIGVETVNGVVTLSGVANSGEQKAKIGQSAAQARGVVEVVNNLTVLDRPALGTFQNIGRQFKDEWVEKRVETAITVNRHVRIRHLDVEVNDGVCVLSGNVDSQEEKELAGSLASAVPGVRELVNDIAVRDEPGAAPVVVLEGVDPVEEPL